MDDFTFKHIEQDDNISGVYDATEVKTYWDSRGVELRTFINALVGILNSVTDSSSGADNVAMTPIPGITAEANTVQAIAEALKVYADSLSMGAVADNAVSTIKIQDNAVTAAKCAADVATQAELDAEVSTRGGADTTLQSNIDNLAGAGRTTETVKGNADTLSALLADYAHYYKKDAGSTDAYVVALSPAITSYTEGMTLDIFCKTANTGAATLDAGGGAKDLKKYYNDALETGDIEAGAIITVKWDSANDWWQVTSGIKVTVVDGTELVKGIVELATVAEAAAGTSTTLAVTPAGIAARSLFNSGSYTGNNANSRAITVGFQPKLVWVWSNAGTRSSGRISSVGQVAVWNGSDAISDSGSAALSSVGFITGSTGSDNNSLNYNGVVYYWETWG